MIEDLGGVSLAAATRGVEVAAPIAAEGSVTFRFQAEAAGNYTLKVRYIGEGLALEARGPSGEAAITPGPPGPFATVSLPLKAATYEITATALGGRSAFVDWELLLNTGVSQGSARSTALVSSGVAVPLPSTTAPAPAPAPTSSMAIPASIHSNAFVSPSTVASGGLIGRSEPGQPIAPVGPAASGGGLALAYAGDGLPEATFLALEAAPGADRPALGEREAPVRLELFGDVSRDEEALAFSSWLDRLAWTQPNRPLPDARAVAAVEGKNEAVPGDVGVGVASEPDQEERAGFSTEVISSVVFVAAVSRWRPATKTFKRRRWLHR